MKLIDIFSRLVSTLRLSPSQKLIGQNAAGLEPSAFSNNSSHSNTEILEDGREYSAVSEMPPRYFERH